MKRFWILLLTTLMLFGLLAACDREDSNDDASISKEQAEHIAMNVIMEHSGLHKDQMEALTLKVRTKNSTVECSFLYGDQEYAYTIDYEDCKVLSFRTEEVTISTEAATEETIDRESIANAQLERESYVVEVVMAHSGLSKDDINVLAVNHDEETKQTDFFFLHGEIEYMYTVNYETGEIISYSSNVPGETTPEVNTSEDAD